MYIRREPDSYNDDQIIVYRFLFASGRIYIYVCTASKETTRAFAPRDFAYILVGNCNQGPIVHIIIKKNSGENEMAGIVIM